MDYERFHQITFYVMYGVIAIAITVIVERLIFYAVNLRHAVELAAAMHSEIRCLADLPQPLVNRDSIGPQAVRELLDTRHLLVDPRNVEDLSEAIYIAMKARLVSRLWILDTVVTAAPLLGLLGTIFGIIDTFAVLAQSGISDPAAVSKGIGTALFATALGIGIAVFGLVFFNLFNEKVARIDDYLKILLLRAVAGSNREQRKRVEIDHE
ncbi:MotA/TolQ/ExbB proton channel family protein [Noviherbaspirillum sp. ST9]|uniref:MotA/TolQ/ExbB proton channel family protein n=1 Tax=Noviherbaspirillum sp. ST9 TaxID=3401606 RepID=UPI003B586940